MPIVGEDGVIALRDARNPALLLQQRRIRRGAASGGGGWPGASSSRDRRWRGGRDVRGEADGGDGGDRGGGGEGAGARVVVGHDLSLDGETVGLVLTGPNMGGKSVALKVSGCITLH